MTMVTIAGLARQGGVGIETIRYYQRRGLLKTPQRGGRDNNGGIRRYGAEEIRRLRFIRSAKAAGFSLEEIAELLALDASHDRARARKLAKERIAALNIGITELETARDSLQRLARACEAGTVGPCPIIAAFEGD
jgi:MerR family mercuric resistance operon transcriptional regulator